MKKKLLFQALTKFSAGALVTGLLLFLPAGSLGFRRGWLLMGLLFGPMFAAGVVMLFRAPGLLEKRLAAKEPQREQRQVVALSGLMFAAGFALAGLDHRFGWTCLPGWTAWAGAAALLLGYGLYAQVLRENAWLSRTVAIQPGQRLVDTGLYGLVRHPMYSATVVLFLAIPLVLGSGAALAVFLTYPILIVRRIRGEEALLEEALPGYRDYQRRVPYRLFPKIW